MKNHKKDFIKAMAVLSEVYDKSLSKRGILIYYRLLEKYPWDRVKAALETILRTSPFFPKPSEIISLVEESAYSEQVEDEEIISSWKMLLSLIRKHGSYSNPFEQELKELSPEQKNRLSEVVEIMGGWKCCCMWEEKDYPRIFNTFSRIYKTVIRTERRKQNLPVPAESALTSKEG